MSTTVPSSKSTRIPRLPACGKCNDVVAAEVDPIGRHLRRLSVHVEFKPLPFLPLLKSDPVCAHAYGNRGVDSDTLGQAAMGVGDRICRRMGH